MPIDLARGTCRSYQELTDELHGLGVKELECCPKKSREGSFSWKYKGRTVNMALSPSHMMLRMGDYFKNIVDAFSKVMSREPFCRYRVRKGNCLVHWYERHPGDSVLNEWEVGTSMGLLEELTILQK
jgi:hypothetical protein